MSDFQTARAANVATPKLPQILEVTDDVVLTPYDTRVVVTVPAAAETLTVSLPPPATCPGMKCLIKISKPGAEAGDVDIVVAGGSSILGTDGAADTFEEYDTDGDFAYFECIAGEFWLHVADKTT